MSPNQRKPGLRQLNVWMADELVAAAKARAASEGTTIAAVIRAALEHYIAEDHPNGPCINQGDGAS